MTASLFRILTIGRNTLLEAVRQKVLNVLLLVAFVLVAASVWYSQVAPPSLDRQGLFDEQIKFVKDAGCGAIDVFGFIIVAWSTAQLIPQELHNRTIYTILAKPVRRMEFLLGKFLGVILLLALCVALMALGFAAMMYLQELRGLSFVHEAYATRPDWRNFPYLVEQYNHDAALVIRQVQDPGLVEAILLIFAKLTMVTGITLLISTFASSSIFTFVTTFMIYLIGHLESAARDVLFALANHQPPFAEKILAGAIALLVPDMSAYSIVDEILSGNAVPWSQAWEMVAYAGAYSVVLLAVSVTIFEHREI